MGQELGGDEGGENFGGDAKSKLNKQKVITVLVIVLWIMLLTAISNMLQTTYE